MGMRLLQHALDLLDRRKIDFIRRLVTKRVRDSGKLFFGGGFPRRIDGFWQYKLLTLPETTIVDVLEAYHEKM